MNGTVLGLIVAGLASPAPAQHHMPQPPIINANYSMHPLCHNMPCAIGNDIYIRPKSSKFVVAHETGHVWWRQVATEHDRATVIPLLGFPTGTPWVQGIVSERAADAYAMCDLGRVPGRSGWVLTDYGYMPTVHQHRAVCKIIAQAGRR